LMESSIGAASLEMPQDSRILGANDGASAGSGSKDKPSMLQHTSPHPEDTLY